MCIYIYICMYIVNKKAGRKLLGDGYVYEVECDDFIGKYFSPK